MENKNQVGSSAIVNDLFGAKDSPSNGVSSSIVTAPSAAVAARNYSTSKFNGNGNEQKLPHGSSPMDTGVQVDMIKDKEGESNFSSIKEMYSIFQQRLKPCPLCSLLYYGGKKDMHIECLSPRTSGPYTDYKKDDGVDDPSGNNSTDVLTGNWWQGSVHY